MTKEESQTICQMPFSQLVELVRNDPETTLPMIMSLAWNKGAQFEADRLHKYYRSMFTRPGAVMYERN